MTMCRSSISTQVPAGGCNAATQIQQQVDSLLAPLDEEPFEQHHRTILRNALPGGRSGAASASLQVQCDAGGGKGKGVFAASSIAEGGRLFKELPLVRSATFTNATLEPISCSPKRQQHLSHCCLINCIDGRIHPQDFMLPMRCMRCLFHDNIQCR